MAEYDIVASSLVLVGCLEKRKRTISLRADIKQQFYSLATVSLKEDRETGK